MTLRKGTSSSGVSVHARSEIENALSSRHLPQTDTSDLRAESVRREPCAPDSGIQAKHVQHHRSQLGLQRGIAVRHRLPGGLAGGGEQIGIRVRASAGLGGKLSLQCGRDGVGFGSQTGGADAFGSARDGFGRSRAIASELLNGEKLGIDHHHAEKNVPALIALDQVERRRTGKLPLADVGQGFESQRDQPDRARGIERPGGDGRRDGFGTAHQAEAGQGLFGAAIQNGDFLWPQVGDGFALLVADDEIEQDLPSGGLEGGGLRQRRKADCHCEQRRRNVRFHFVS